MLLTASMATSQRTACCLRRLTVRACGLALAGPVSAGDVRAVDGSWVSAATVSGSSVNSASGWVG